MVANYLLAVFATVLATVAIYNLAMPAITRRGLLFGVTIAPEARASARGRSIIRRYRVGVVVVTLLCGAGLAALRLAAPADWWERGWLAPLSIILALLPCLPYIPAHLAARSLAGPVAPMAAGEHAPAAVLRPRTYHEYVPWIWEALPLGLLAATIAYLAASYAAAPAIIPIHFGANGQPNRYVTKTIGSYFVLVWTQLTLEVLLTLLAVLVARAKALPDRADDIFRRRTLRYLYAVKVLTIALLGGLAAWIAHLEAVGSAQATWVLPITLVFIVVVVVLGLAVALRTGQGGARLPEASASDRLDDRYWRGGVIYVNRDDPALIVERRFGFGWTFNFGNPRAWLLLAVILAVPFISIVVSVFSTR